MATDLVGSWTQQGSLTTGPGPGCVFHNGYLYAVQSGNTKYATWDGVGAIGTWNNTTALPAANTFCGLSVCNGYLYATGGGSGVTTVYYALINSDGTLGSWSTGTALPDSRTYHAMVTYNGHLIVAGGYKPSASRATVWYCTPDAGTGANGAWTATTSMAGTGKYGSGYAVVNSRLYLCGGSNYTSNLATVIYADLNNDGTVGTWNTAGAANLPAIRLWPQIWTYDNDLYVAGGLNTSSAYMSDVYYADVATDGTIASWSTSSYSIPQPFAYGAASAQENSRVALYGGWTTGGASANVYTNSTATITEYTTTANVAAITVASGEHNGFAATPQDASPYIYSRDLVAYPLGGGGEVGGPTTGQIWPSGM